MSATVASATPGANRVPKADDFGIIADGWLPDIPISLIPPTAQPTAVAAADAATIAINAALGNFFTVTVTADRAIGAPTNPTSGQVICIAIKQDGTGSRLITLNAIFRFGADPASYTATVTADKTDYIFAMYNGLAAKWDVIHVKKGF